MINHTLTDKEILCLKAIIGKKLVSIKSQKPDVTNKIFGNILLITDKQYIEIRNEFEPTPFYESNEDISKFKVKSLLNISSFMPMIDDVYIDMSINETVREFVLVRDTIDVKDKSGNIFYSIMTDTAIIIKTLQSMYIVSRDWFLEEEMLFAKTIDYQKDVYLLDKVINDWSDEENGFIASCHREEIHLSKNRL